MIRHKLVTYLALAIVIATVGCQTNRPASLKDRLPPPLKGFRWEVFEDVSVAILSPDGWHRAVSKGNGTYTGSVSVEDFEKDGIFKTGFTVQVISGVKKRTGSPASMIAVAMGQEISSSPENEVLDSDPLKEKGNIQSCLIRYRNSPILGRKITVHTFFVASDKSDILYIYTFESPTETWESSFEKFGGPMMERIVMTGMRN